MVGRNSQQLMVTMSYKLGEENNKVSYTRYRSPSAYRECGAFLPKKLMYPNIYRYRLSPYMGCPKRCAYCFELYDKWHGLDEVKIKTNTVEIVKEKISQQKQRDVILLDGYDCERAEIRERLVRNSLKVILEYRMPLLIQTKSDLVLKDLDILEQLNNKTNFLHVAFSITDLNSSHHRMFESHTCAPKNRLKAMKTISEAGISTGLLLMPVLPYISDTQQELEHLFKEASKNGCQYVIYGPLRVAGSGPQRERWFSTLEKYFPYLVKRYEELYPYEENAYKFGNIPRDYTYLKELSRKIAVLERKYGMDNDISKPEIDKAKPEIDKRSITPAGQRTLSAFM
ncbi:MAG: radical SAM protein [Euryarchaeota archaeon]|nr:radical SAM protein [Euryarchaeota archaeon]